MRMAFSVASAPPLVKNTMSRLSGATSTMRRAASLRAGVGVERRDGAQPVGRSWIAAISLGCWWPMLTFISWLEKSRYRLPS
jgi:hypothetical protein